MVSANRPVARYPLVEPVVKTCPWVHSTQMRSLRPKVGMRRQAVGAPEEPGRKTRAHTTMWPVVAIIPRER